MTKLKNILRKHLSSKKGLVTKGEKPACTETVFISLGECDKAKEYLEKPLAIKKEIRDKTGVATSYRN